MTAVESNDADQRESPALPSSRGTRIAARPRKADDEWVHGRPKVAATVRIVGMSIPFGKLPLGSCEIIDGQRVFTRFFFLGPFLVPMDSAYVAGTGEPFPVRRHSKSIALAYARWIVLPLAMAITFIAGAGSQSGAPEMSGPVESALIALAVVWFGLVFVAGRVRGDEARKRRVMNSQVGHAAAPEWLFDGTVSIVLDELSEKWKPKKSWRDTYPKDVPPNLLPLYYTLCRYEAVRTNRQVMATRARLSWHRLEAY